MAAMQTGRRNAARRSALLLAFGVLAITAAVATVPAWRHGVMRSIGWMLVAQDAPAKADIIVVSTDSLSAGMLEAADLVAAGFASRVAIFQRPGSELQHELKRRGAPSIDLQDYSIQLLRSQGVSNVVLLPAVMGTIDEGEALQAWCAANSIHSLLFVSVKDHSRRTRRVLQRALRRQDVEVMVRYARWSVFDPDSWWQTRNGQRVQIVESEKLFVDVLRHPF